MDTEDEILLTILGTIILLFEGWVYIQIFRG